MGDRAIVTGPSIPQKRVQIIIGISDASGIIYDIRLLEILRRVGAETHLVMPRAGQMTLIQETSHSVADINALAGHVYADQNIGAAISTGSFRTAGMIIAPCSIRTPAEIAAGTMDNLISRATDEVLKEHCRLVLLVRETPLHIGHLRAMTAVSEIGAIAYPPMSTFYPHPATADDLINHTVGRVLELFHWLFCSFVVRYRQWTAS